MSSNLDKFKADLKALSANGNDLLMAMQYDCYPDKVQAALKKQLKDKAAKYIADLPNFKASYQRWYSEALAMLRQLLPHRVNDFVRLYEKPKPRKDIGFENYRIEDYLQGLQVTRLGEVLVDGSAAIPHFRQQLAIVEAAQARFESSLFDIRQMLQADLFDSELETAEHLAKYKFGRAAGAVAGVVLERHLSQVTSNHAISITKKNPTIADFNEALKAADVIDLPQWRYIQHLADLRNLCDHAKVPDPTLEQVSDLVSGVKKVTKTVF
jgi:tetratricopeptide (TPR) repeat protein